jgi:uncharacterized membrane protein (DUF2068 family)
VIRAGPLRAIVLYKTIKGALQLALAVFLAIGAFTGFAHQLAAFGGSLRHHLTLAWAMKLASWSVTAATRKHLLLVSLALALDGALTSVEAWALHVGHWWGPWLVVAATGSLLPYELLELIRHPHVGRLALFLVNGAIVAYLATHARRMSARALLTRAPPPRG